MAGERVARTNKQRMLVVTTLAPPTAGERVARTNKQRMLVVTTLAPPTVTVKGTRGSLNKRELDNKNHDDFEQGR